MKIRRFYAPMIVRNPTLKERQEIAEAIIQVVKKADFQKLLNAIYDATTKWKKDGKSENQVYSAIGLLDDHTRDKKIFYTFKFRDAYPKSTAKLQAEYKTKIESFKELCSMLLEAKIVSDKFFNVREASTLNIQISPETFYINKDNPLKRSYDGVRIDPSWIRPELLDGGTMPPSEPPKPLEPYESKCHAGTTTTLTRLSNVLASMNQNLGHQWMEGQKVKVLKIIKKGDSQIWASIQNEHGNMTMVNVKDLACNEGEKPPEKPEEKPEDEEEESEDEEETPEKPEDEDEEEEDEDEEQEFTPISGYDVDDLIIFHNDEINKECIVVVQKTVHAIVRVGSNTQEKLGDGPVPLTDGLGSDPKNFKRFVEDSKGNKIKLGINAVFASQPAMKLKVVGFFGMNKEPTSADILIVENLEANTSPKYSSASSNVLLVYEGEKPEEKPEDKPAEAAAAAAASTGAQTGAAGTTPVEEKPPKPDPIVPEDFILKVKSVDGALEKYFKFPEPKDREMFISTWFMRSGGCVLKGAAGTGKTVLLQLTAMCMGGMAWKDLDIKNFEALLEYYTANDIFGTTQYNSDKEPEDVFFATDISIEKSVTTGDNPIEKSTYLFSPRPRPIVTSFIKLHNEVNRVGPNCADALLGLLAERRVEYKGQFFFSPNRERHWWGHLNFFDYNPHLDVEGYELDRALLDRIDVGIYLSGGGLNIRYGILKRKNEAAKDIPEIFFDAIKAGDFTVLSPDEVCDIWRLVKEIYVDDETLRWIAFLSNIPNITIRKYNPQSYFRTEGGKPVPINEPIDTTVISYKGVKSNMPAFTPTAQPTATRVDVYSTLDALDRPLGARSALSMLNLVRSITFYEHCLNGRPLHFMINDTNRVDQVIKLLTMLPYLLDHRVNIGVGKDIQSNFLNFGHYIKYFFIPAVAGDEQNHRLEDWMVAMKIIGTLKKEATNKRRDEFLKKYGAETKTTPAEVKEKVKTDPFFHHLFILSGEHVEFEADEVADKKPVRGGKKIVGGKA